MALSLRPMSAAEFERYAARAIPEYAAAHARAGDAPPAKALRKAREEYAELLPKGVATAGHHLYAITLDAAGPAIGMLWFEARKGKAFIFDFRLDKAHRGKGLGRRALRALEREARQLGVASIGLHVFGDNRVARSLYEKAGYRYTGMRMAKKLRPSTSRSRASGGRGSRRARSKAR